MPKIRFTSFLIGTAALLLSTATPAQLLGVQVLPPVGVPSTVGNLPVAGPMVRNLLDQPGARQAVAPTLDSVGGLTGAIAQSGSASLLELRRLRLQELIRSNRATVESDGDGLPVRRSRVVAVNPTPGAMYAVQGAGFRVVADESSAHLGLRVVTLATPRGMSARKGLALLRRAAPGIEADFDHLYEPAGGALLTASGAALAASDLPRADRVIGMIDGGVASHPALAGKSIEQKGFSGAPKPTGHGTAVASLLVGGQGPFRGAAPGASLFVADVYGGNRAAGSATSIVRALGWLSASGAPVINISLVGPSNKVVERAIRTVRGRGAQVVAAVGNDGPAAPPQYPASYAGVISITAVDGRGRALPEAGKPIHLDFAAPGADMAAALPGKGYTKVRGTSFASPLAAARLLATGSTARLAVEARPGRGRIGRGVVCSACRVEPRAVGAK